MKRSEQPRDLAVMENQLSRVTLVGEARCLWRYQIRNSGRSYEMGAPVFEVDGRPVPCAVGAWQPVAEPRELPNGCKEFRFTGNLIEDPHLSLEIAFRLAKDSPVVRFSYTLRGTRPARLTKEDTGRDNLLYLRFSAAEAPRVTEVRLADFNELYHSYTPVEEPVAGRDFEDRQRLLGPILVLAGEGYAALAAYEHGSTAPQTFLGYHLLPDRAVELRAEKGNYCTGQPLDAEGGYETIWFQFAAVEGDEEALAAAYRRFLLRYQALQPASRTPYIFYNTWGSQERNQWWRKASFWGDIKLDIILQEIDVAHAMGIEVFVIDTGWYGQCGEWRVNEENFPDGLQQVKARLEGYGMKLGLWFSPDLCAVATEFHETHRDCQVSWQGKLEEPFEVWGTPKSVHFCLISRWAETFADELIRLHREVGVTYFKWDAIQQYLCDAPGHGHGEEENTAAERADCHAFELPRAMVRIVERLAAECPEAIVDFDVTEKGRCVGLGFLAAGKYFLINNGPYYGNYNFPEPKGEWSNLFVWPGPARTWICRAPLTYDRWVPSVLFLCHYLPDDPAESQRLNLASLVLGHNGIWGDLLPVSAEGVKLIAEVLGRYKQVRDDITEANPVVRGALAGALEVHEKLAADSGRGVVAIFSTAAGVQEYVTEARVAPAHWETEGVSVEIDAHGRAILTATFETPGAKLVFFGVE